MQRGIFMNMDNQRLQDIQQLKAAYTNLKQQLKDANSISECLEIQKKIDELGVEEKEILERFDVIV
jgi:hypothetical protein